MKCDTDMTKLVKAILFKIWRTCWSKANTLFFKSKSNDSLL